jgi:hypothetical protein
MSLLPSHPQQQQQHQNSPENPSASSSPSPSSTTNNSILLFSAPLIRQLNAARFPGNYVGVRRIRPSNRIVANTARSGGAAGTARAATSAATTSNVAYKVEDAETGQERRMTRQEKRDCKQQHREQAKKRKLEERQQEKEELVVEKEKINANRDEKSDVDVDRPIDEDDPVTESEGSGNQVGNDHYYMQLKVDPNALEEELADLRGDRDGVPPVVLPPALARIALGTRTDNDEVGVMDDQLAGLWAVALKDSMKGAEDRRSTETGLRPMPYHLVPEVWSRMRPRPRQLGAGDAVHPEPSPLIGNPSTSAEWCYCSLRDVGSGNTIPANAIAQALHADSGLHIACGAKFGSDYLIYDGPRNERHAFAGLRIFDPARQIGTSSDCLHYEFPLPTAYDLAGYVRGLNTAGKLDGTRVAVVDLALVKIAVTTSRRSKKTLEQRMKNLAKATTTKVGE